MKYEYLKGSEKDFEGAPEWATKLLRDNNDSKKSFVGDLGGVTLVAEKMNPHSWWKYNDGYVGAIIAERRPLTEPLWDGAGLPPVGCECEVLYDTGRDEWFLAKIIGHDNGSVVGRWLNGDGLYSLFDYSHASCSFRQIRTEADKKRDAAIKALDNWLPEYTTDIPSLDGAIAMYDAIAAGKITGVKLED